MMVAWRTLSSWVEAVRANEAELAELRATATTETLRADMAENVVAVLRRRVHSTERLLSSARNDIGRLSHPTGNDDALARSLATWLDDLAAIGGATPFLVREARTWRLVVGGRVLSGDDPVALCVSAFDAEVSA